MLARAVHDTPDPYCNVAYIRGNAVELPFRDAAFDAVCCFAALHLFDEPFRALDHMARVLTPGGRIAIFTSCRDELVAAAHDRRRCSARAAGCGCSSATRSPAR